jgi:hypothetical protein
MRRQSILGILATVFVFAVVFAGAAKNASAQQICGNNSSGPLGNVNQYIFGGDQWNSSFSGTNQCETITNSTAPPPSGPSMVYSGAAFDDTTGTPADYPDFLYGCFHGGCSQNTQLPIQVSALSNWSITSGETVVEPSGASNDVAYDIWFNTGSTAPTNENTTGTEMMIWVQRNGGVGPNNPVATFTSSGYTWNVYTWTNTGNCGGCSGTGSQVIDFINSSASSDGPTNGTTFNLDLVPFFEEALALGQIQSSWYLTTIEFGTEIWVGGPGLQVNNFWVNVAPAGTGGGATLATGTPYNIVNENSGSCVDATKEGTANGTTVQQWACAEGTASTQTNQEWEFTSAGGGYYEITNVNAPSEAWNVTGNGTTNGSLLQLWTYAGNPNEEWQAISLGNGYYEFVNQGSGLCLDTPGASAANGVQLDIYTCNGTGAQAFKLVTP